MGCLRQFFDLMVKVAIIGSFGHNCLMVCTPIRDLTHLWNRDPISMVICMGMGLGMGIVLVWILLCVSV